MTVAMLVFTILNLVVLVAVFGRLGDILTVSREFRGAPRDPHESPGKFTWSHGEPRDQ